MKRRKIVRHWPHGGLVEWLDGNTAFLSIVFSWNLHDAFQRAAWHRALGRDVIVGGPAVTLNPNYFNGVAIEGEPIPDVISKHNPMATFTSRGCIRRCPFCAVPIMEGGLVELNDWPVRPHVCDNNLLACSRRHFDSVVDKLKPLSGIDFNQGLDARLLTNHHANRIAELDLYVVRLAWDHIGLENQFMTAFQRLRDARIPVKKIRAYVLIGYNDTPDDALYRLEAIKALGAWPNPMRYQPLNAIKRNGYVAPGWTDAELKRFMRYWSNLRWLEHIPFAEYTRAW